MTTAQKTELLHSVRGPLFSLLGGLIAAGVMWVIGAGTRSEKVNGRITAVEATAQETKGEFKSHCIKQDDHDLKLAETLGAMKESLKNIENQTKY